MVVEIKDTESRVQRRKLLSKVSSGERVMLEFFRSAEHKGLWEEGAGRVAKVEFLSVAYHREDREDQLKQIAEIVDYTVPPVVEGGAADEQGVIDAWVHMVPQAKKLWEELQKRKAREREEFNREMRAWAERTQNKRVLRSIEMGFEAKGSYVRERANRELVGFKPLPRDSYYEALHNPSRRAIELWEIVSDKMRRSESVGALQCELVMTTDGADNNWEALLVRDYLGRYEMVRRVDNRESLARHLNQLYQLTNCGVYLRDAVRLVGEDSEDPELRPVLLEMAGEEDSSDRWNWADQLSRWERDVFPRSVVELLRQGEKAGEVPKSLRAAVEMLRAE